MRNALPFRTHTTYSIMLNYINTSTAYATDYFHGIIHSNTPLSTQIHITRVSLPDYQLPTRANNFTTYFNTKRLRLSPYELRNTKNKDDLVSDKTREWVHTPGTQTQAEDNR